MVNFRFHLVSLTAVFLALAAGITVGAGVVNRATVAQIERQLETVQRNTRQTNAENDQLRLDLRRWGDFSQQAGDRLLEGKLTGTTVVLVGTTGIKRDVMEGLRGSLSSAGGATVAGTIWFTSKWALNDARDLRELSTVIGLGEATPEDARAAAISRVASAWGSGDGGVLVTDLRDRGYIEYEEGATPAFGLGEVPAPQSVFVLLSGDDADVAPADLAIPLAGRLTEFGVPLLAAQPTRAPAPEGSTANAKELPPEFVVALRQDAEVSARISTVDNAEDYRGRVAAVLALGALREGRTGHYGFLQGARIAPERAPQP